MRCLGRSYKFICRTSVLSGLIGNRLDPNLDLERFGFDAAADGEAAGVFGDPDDDLALLFDKAAGAEEGGFEAIAPNFTDIGLLQLAGSNIHRDGIDQARIAKRYLEGSPHRQRQCPQCVDRRNNVVRRSRQVRRDTLWRACRIFGIILDKGDALFLVVKISNAVANAFFLNVVFGRFDNSKRVAVDHRFVLLGEAVPKELEERTFRNGLGLDEVIVRARRL